MISLTTLRYANTLAFGFMLAGKVGHHAWLEPYSKIHGGFSLVTFDVDLRHVLLESVE